MISEDFINSELPYVDNLRDLVVLMRKGGHSHVRVHEKVFVIASRKPQGMATLQEIERINAEFGLTLGLLGYDSAPCDKCGHVITGYDFIKSAVKAHGARFLSNESMRGFLLRLSQDPLMITCPSCQALVASGVYEDHHMHGPYWTCFAYGCCRALETLENILRMMESGARAYQKRIGAMKL